MWQWVLTGASPLVRLNSCSNHCKHFLRRVFFLSLDVSFLGGNSEGGSEDIGTFVLHIDLHCVREAVQMKATNRGFAAWLMTAAEIPVPLYTTVFLESRMGLASCRILITATSCSPLNSVAVSQGGAS